ncbi:hypothetical protein R80B4_02461 [Fibrobacteres bacterium R8-0-B4]
MDETRTIVVVKNHKDKRKKGIKRRGICKSRGDTNRRIDKTNCVEYWYTGSSDDTESIGTFLGMACAEGINSILIEGGQRLASAFLENGFVNKLYLFYGSKIFGDGLDGLSFSRGLTVDNPLTLGDISYQRIGDDLLATGYVKKLTL